LTSPGNSSPVLKRTDRSVAVAGLIFANLALILILLPLAIYAGRFYRLHWPNLCCSGLMSGQVIWFALWFTYSRSSLLYRAALVVVVGSLFGVGFVVGPWLATMPSTHWHLLFRADNRQLEEMKIAAIGFWMLVWLIFILLLPAKRLRGISLGNPAMNIAPRSRPYQVSIWDLMLWTCVVIVPLGVVRVFLAQYLAEVFFQVLLMAGFGLVFGLPTFRAAFAERRPMLWLLALGTYVVFLTFWIVEFFFLQSKYFTQANSPPLRESLSVASIACLVVYTNCWVLRRLGLRWLKTLKKADAGIATAEPPPHLTTIAPQPSSL